MNTRGQLPGLKRNSNFADQTGTARQFAEYEVKFNRPRIFIFQNLKVIFGLVSGTHYCFVQCDSTEFDLNGKMLIPNCVQGELKEVL